ncbi:glycosyltransferase, partial [Candidatus Kapabacteria bacterium]|nr:glycosyltransferase [Candidatus Kapabacteria bacterium]
MNVELIIISYNSTSHFDELFRSIFAQDYKGNLTITVVDNCSSDNSVKYIQNKFPDVKLILSPKNIGYGAAANLGANNSNADLVFICNSDLILFRDTITNAVNSLTLNEHIGILGGQQQYPNGDWQKSYGSFPSLKKAFQNLVF